MNISIDLLSRLSIIQSSTYISNKISEDLCKKFLIQKLSEFEVFDLITVPPAMSEAEAALRLLVLETASMSIFRLVASALQIDEPPLGSIPSLLKVYASPATALKPSPFCLINTQESATDSLKPQISRPFFNMSYQLADACFKPYNDFLSLST